MLKNMRIALVNDYSLNQISGAATSMFQQQRALQAAGHEVSILQLGVSERSRNLDGVGIIWVTPSFTLPGNVVNLPILMNSAKNYTAILELLKKNRIEVVHLQSEMSLAHLVARAARELGIPVFTTIHTLFWQYDGPAAGIVAAIARKFFETVLHQKIEDRKPSGNALEKFLKNITLDIATQSKVAISPSQHQKEIIEKTELKTPVVVLPNPFGATSTLPAKLVSQAPHTIRFMWVGRCVPEKRPLEFLEAVKLASEQSNIPFHIDIVGDGSLLAEMKAKYGLKNVTYHGRTTPAAAVALMDQSDVVCTSSYHFDNQPMVIAEALSRFRPIFYCDERLTEGTSIAGYLTKNETSAAMAAGIIDLIEHPEKVVTLSQKARLASKIFAPQTFAKNVIKLYTA